MCWDDFEIIYESNLLLQRDNRKHLCVSLHRNAALCGLTVQNCCAKIAQLIEYSYAN